jgi:enamine deaminase RidA (YjgF/YER057c/UK114 family)
MDESCGEWLTFAEGRALLTPPSPRKWPLIRINIASGYPFEDEYGYARAVRVGDHVFVSGTTARPPDLDGDAYTQMKGAIVTVAAALAEAGAELRHVVRTVVYILDMADAHHIARAHRETFGGSRPASTLVQVAALTPASARVEIEMTAVVHD